MMRTVLLYVALKIHMEGRERQHNVAQTPVSTLSWIQLEQMHLLSLVSS